MEGVFYYFESGRGDGLLVTGTEEECRAILEAINNSIIEGMQTEDYPPVAQSVSWAKFERIPPDRWGLPIYKVSGISDKIVESFKSLFFD